MPAGKNKVLMAPLRTALTKAGLENVQTYIQSGNVVAASSLSQSRLEKLVHDVIARTAAQFKDTMKKNPFVRAEKPRLYFSLLASQPEPGLVKELLSTDFSPDKIRVVADIIYTLYDTKYSDSRFNNNFFECKLNIAATTRNFNTMIKFIELSAV